MKPSAKLVVFGALLGGVSFASGAFAEPLVRARSAHFSLPTKAKFSPLLRRRFLARCRMDWCHWVSLENVHSDRTLVEGRTLRRESEVVDVWPAQELGSSPD